MSNLYRAVVFCLALAAATQSAAQQTVLYSVDGWPAMGTRADGKLDAWYFRLASDGTGPAPGLPRDAFLDIPVTRNGDPVLQFIRASSTGTILKSVLIEHPLATETGGRPAPFAVRMSNVTVVSVDVAVSYGNLGCCVAVRLRPQRVELFSSAQGPAGKPGPVSRFGYDVKTGKAF